jgi:hypothetical protein
MGDQIRETKRRKLGAGGQGTALHFGTGKGHALSNERFFGEMLGMPIGTLFSNRQSLYDAEVHVSPQPR